MLTYSVDDDLESLLYVILYLAVLWLPLEDRDQCAADVIGRMCEDWSIQSGRLVALGKKFNQADRQHTEPLKWKNGSFQVFMNKMLDILNPMVETDEEHPFPNQWTCNNIKAFWEDFLCRCGNELPSMGRELCLPDLGDLADNAPQNITGQPNFPTVSSRGTKCDHCLFVSDGAGTSMARHMGAQLTLGAPGGEGTLSDDETSSDLRATEQSEDITVKRRRLTLETELRTIVEAKPSHLPATMFPSILISSNIDFTPGLIIPHIPAMDGLPTCDASQAGSSAAQLCDSTTQPSRGHHRVSARFNGVP